MKKFETMRLPPNPDAVAPDGADVWNLLRTDLGGMAIFQLPPGAISNPEVHKTVDEIWFFLSGRGEFWRKLGDQEEVVVVEPGVCITVPVGTHFHWRVYEGEPLRALGVTMPPWPGAQEGIMVEGYKAWHTTG